MWFPNLVTLLFIIAHLCREIHGEEEDNPFYLKAHNKIIPRIGRSGDSEKARNDDFEKFFMKASKSVPRIGRRNEVTKYGNNNNKDADQAEIIGHLGMNERFKYPTWSNIADAFEYHPELLISPEMMSRLQEQMSMADDPSVYEWDKIRMKRTIPLPLQDNK